MATASGAKAEAEQQAARWKTQLGRAGLSARGVFYAIFGWLALQFALGDAGSGQVSEGSVFAVVKAQSTWLLGLLTAGLLALALWQLVRAFVGDPVAGSETKDRAMYALKGVLYGATFVTALTSLLGGGSGGGGGGGGDSGSQAAGAVFGLPGGVFIVGAVGVGLVAYAAKQVKENVLDSEFMQRLSRGEMDRSTEEAVEKAGRAGYAGRAVGIATIGVLAVVAALQHDPQEAKGMGGALVQLSQTTYGPWILGVVAIGLIGFGAFSLAEAKYRRDH